MFIFVTVISVCVKRRASVVSVPNIFALQLHYGVSGTILNEFGPFFNICKINNESPVC